MPIVFLALSCACGSSVQRQGEVPPEPLTSGGAVAPVGLLVATGDDACGMARSYLKSDASFAQVKWSEPLVATDKGLSWDVYVPWPQPELCSDGLVMTVDKLTGKLVGRRLLSYCL